MSILRWLRSFGPHYTSHMPTFGTPSMPPRAEMVRAMLSCDPGYEGVFYTAVRTTGIFCRPTCTARKPNPENVEFYARVDEAMAAGFRPCKRCRPLQMPGDVPDWISVLIKSTEIEPNRRWSDAEIAAAGFDPVRVRRWFRQHFAMTFHAWNRSLRLGTALEGLHEGDSIDGVALDQGYESTSGFRDAFQKRFATTPGRARDRAVLRFRRVATPLGPMMVMSEARGLVLMEFIDRPALTREIETLKHRHGYAVAPGTNAHIDQVEQEIDEYFAGQRKAFECSLWMPGSDFEQAVWQMLLTIPYGETSTYGGMAERLGQRGAARAIGAANGRNRLAIVVPCHRVVAGDGKLGGYGGGMPRKSYLLRLERDFTATAKSA